MYIQQIVDISRLLLGSCGLKYSLVNIGNTPNSGDRIGDMLFFIIFFGILAIIIYKLCGGRRSRNDYLRSDSPTDHQPPPPPYSPYSKYSYPQQPYQGWRPGFWTGLGLGGVGTHLFDNWRNNSHSHDDVFRPHRGNSGFYNDPGESSRVFESTSAYGSTETR